MRYPIRILAFDTSTKTGAIACLEKTSVDATLEVRSFWTMSVEMQHSEGLLWAIDQSLAACRWNLSTLTQIAVGVGPGSFTGVRIGVLTARTMAQGLKCSILEIDSLRLVAHSVRLGLTTFGDNKEDVVFIVATDAAKGEWFSNVSRESSWVVDDVKSVNLTPDQLVDQVKTRLKPDDRWLVLGPKHIVQSKVWLDHLPKHQEIKRHEDHDALGIIPTARGFLGAVQEALAKSSAQKTNPLDVRPNYLRASEAEVKREKDLLANRQNANAIAAGVD